MTDNVTSGSAGAIFATDNRASPSEHWPLSKVCWGTRDTNYNVVDLTNPLPVQEPDVLTVAPASVTSATTVFTQDTTGYRAVAVQVTSAGTSCTVTYECSNDNSTWVAISGTIAGTVGSVASTSTVTGLMFFPAVARYFRARVSTYGSGTVTAGAILRKTDLGSLGVTATLNLNVVADVDASTTITAGGTAQQLLAVNAARRYLYIQNVSAGNIGIKLTGTTPVIGNSGTITLAPGASYERAINVPTNAVWVIGATTSQAVTCVYQ